MKFIVQILRWLCWCLIVAGPIVFAFLGVKFMSAQSGYFMAAHSSPFSIQEIVLYSGVAALPVVFGIIGLRFLKLLTPS